MEIAKDLVAIETLARVQLGQAFIDGGEVRRLVDEFIDDRLEQFFDGLAFRAARLASVANPSSSIEMESVAIDGRYQASAQWRRRLARCRTCMP